MDREANIRKALDGLKSRKYKSIRAASRDTGVPHPTLIYCLKGGQSCRDSHVAYQACTPAEEEALIQWIKEWHSRGFPIRPEELRDMARHLILSRINSSGRNTISTYLTSHNWPSRFIKRHPDLKGLLVESIEKPRHTACTPETFKEWFDRFRENFDKYKPTPRNIYNIDETGFTLEDSEKAYVIIDKRLESTGRRVKAKKGELLTSIECASATGYAIPPMVIYKGEYLQHHWFEPSAPRDWVVATSPKGWTSNALGLWWLQNHFEPSTRPLDDGYRFLILDGHGSHVTPEFQDFCIAKRIILLCLPPHTSHMLQPLDVAVFSPLKHYFRRATERRLWLECSQFPKTEFLQTYSEVRPQAITKKNIQSGFRKAGLVPFELDKVLKRLPAPPQPASPNAMNSAFQIIPQTPRNQTDICKLENCLQDPGSVAVKAAKKIAKAALTFHAKATIAEAECDNLRAESKRMQEAASRKRKRVLGKEPRRVGEVLDLSREGEQGTNKRPRTQAREQTYRSPSPYHVEIDQEGLLELEDNGIGDCIVVIPRFS
jgi:hypothetical protein